MRNAGWHDDGLACLKDVRGTVDGDFGGAFEDGGHGIAGSGVGADGFTGIEGKKGDAAAWLLGKGAADYFARFGLHLLCQGCLLYTSPSPRDRG